MADEYWLDYSAGWLTGEQVKAAGYKGVIRYVDSPGERAAALKRGQRKHTNPAETASMRAAGIHVLLVFQTTNTASAGGFPTGVAHARRAAAGAAELGYSGPIAFTNDNTLLTNPAEWRGYLDGAASVLGSGRVWAYGFANALNAAVGHASGFWQAGARRTLVPHADIWQDNNTQVYVAGILCDRNLIIDHSAAGGVATEEDDMDQATFGNFLVNARWGKDNRNLFDQGNEIIAQVAASRAVQAQTLAAVTGDDVTREIIEQTVNDAVEKHALKLTDVVPALLPLLEDVAARVEQRDNESLAQAVVRQLGAELRDEKPGVSA